MSYFPCSEDVRHLWDVCLPSRPTGGDDKSATHGRTVDCKVLLSADDTGYGDEVHNRPTRTEHPMSYPYEPNTALDLFKVDHQRRINDAQALRQAKAAREPSGNTRRRVFIAAAIVVATFATAGISVTRSSATSDSTATSTCDLGGTYRTGCRLVPGHPDGWHNPSR